MIFAGQASHFDRHQSLFVRICSTTPMAEQIRSLRQNWLRASADFEFESPSLESRVRVPSADKVPTSPRDHRDRDRVPELQSERTDKRMIPLARLRASRTRFGAMEILVLNHPQCVHLHRHLVNGKWKVEDQIWKSACQDETGEGRFSETNSVVPAEEAVNGWE
ncbi:hypothetical protein DFH07DRAFT_770628 [Mycena maculata]|uniref:Uncharacterized protein n=1 Tax=Mycena maculata TaxID=230809 RepID=A0AAD7JI90_9AGAR|nr:hypothetical protein DFH07DRAFT_770628 [Mycena maculata]